MSGGQSAGDMGRATLATLVSSTSMNVARVTDQRDDPGVDRWPPTLKSAGIAAAALIYLTMTLGSTDIPRRSCWSEFWFWVHKEFSPGTR